MYDITSSIWETFCPLYLWHRTHYVWQHNPVCWLHHTRHIYDIICTTEDVLSPLSHQATIFMTSRPLQAWHHTSSIRHCTHCIFVITTSPLISHPLLYDITPTICVISYALYKTSYPLLMSSHYCTYDSTTLTYETTSSMQFNRCTIHVTSQSLVCVITPSVLRASHPLFVWHHTRHRYSIFCTIEDITCSLYEIKPPVLWHHTHYIWHRIDTFSITTSTLLMISHQLYLWNLIFYICRHHIHYVQQHIHYICTITATVPVSHTHFPWYHTLCIYDLAPTICLTSDTLYKLSNPQFMTSRHITYDITCTVFMSSLPRYLTLHPQYLFPHNPSKYDLWQLYVWHHTHFIYDILCTIHNVTSTLWVHTIVVITLHPLHS